MTEGGGSLNVAVRNACATAAADLAAALARMPPTFGLPRQDPGHHSTVILPTVILFDADRDDDLAAMLAEPAVAIIDVGCDDPIGGLARLPSALLVRVSTAMALRRDLAGPLATALCHRLPQARGIAAAVRTALQEAIGNAVMHGNLGLPSSLRAEPDGLADFARLMESRAANPLYARRPVTIAAKWNARGLVVTVEDRGEGYRAGHGGRLPAATAISGRGLAEIRFACRRVNVLAQGRRISMRFSLDPRSTPR